MRRRGAPRPVRVLGRTLAAPPDHHWALTAGAFVGHLVDTTGIEAVTAEDLGLEGDTGGRWTLCGIRPAAGWEAMVRTAPRGLRPCPRCVKMIARSVVVSVTPPTHETENPTHAPQERSARPGPDRE